MCVSRYVCLYMADQKAVSLQHAAAVEDEGTQSGSKTASQKL